MWRDALFDDPPLSIEAIRRQLRTRTVGRRISLYDEVTSSHLHERDPLGIGHGRGARGHGGPG